MPRLKIGLIIDTSLDTTEGVPQYVMAIGMWLRAQGHDVHYLAGETHRSDIPNMHSLARNVHVRFNGTATTIPLVASRRKLRRFMKEQKFDVLHVQTPHHPLMAQRLIMAARLDTAVVASFHIMPYGWLSRWGARALAIWLRPSLKRIDTMLAVSSVAAEYEQWAFGIPANISPNTIDYQRFNRALPLPQYSNTFTILFLGRLVPRKGCAILLQAVKLLHDKHPLHQLRVVICGKGQLQEALKQYVAAHNMQDYVEFVGYVDDEQKTRYYASADVAVFPSSGGESFGIVLLEAMASGQATVLAGDNPGYASVMQPKPELLFSAKDPAVLAGKLQWLIDNPAERQRLAAWGAEYTKQFDINVVGKQLVTLYEQALHSRRNVR